MIQDATCEALDLRSDRRLRPTIPELPKDAVRSRWGGNPEWNPLFRSWTRERMSQS
jgi:hypothetical protein